MSELKRPRTIGTDHIGLAVRSLPLSQNFFCDCLGWTIVGERPDYPAAFVSDGRVMLTLWQVEDPDLATSFDRRKNVGLHHLALRVASLEELETLYAHVTSWAGVSAEFAPTLSGKGPKTHFMIREPSGIRVEFVYDPRL